MLLRLSESPLAGKWKEDAKMSCATVRPEMAEALSASDAGE